MPATKSANPPHKFIIAIENRNDPISEVLRTQIAKEQWQSYEFQPELSYIAKNEPTEIGTAFEFANTNEIKKFLSELDFKEYPDQMSKFRVITAISESEILTEHPDSSVRALVSAKLTEVAESPDFKRGQQKAADRGLEKVRDRNTD